MNVLFLSCFFSGLAVFLLRADTVINTPPVVEQKTGRNCCLPTKHSWNDGRDSGARAPKEWAGKEGRISGICLCGFWFAADDLGSGDKTGNYAFPVL